MDNLYTVSTAKPKALGEVKVSEVNYMHPMLSDQLREAMLATTRPHIGERPAIETVTANAARNARAEADALRNFYRVIARGMSHTEPRTAAQISAAIKAATGRTIHHRSLAQTLPRTLQRLGVVKEGPMVADICGQIRVNTWVLTGAMGGGE